ncbi:hypothetical protein MTYP_02477 [Methylophilaceae bacterium]|nr:hypothetical protein MTYP_02477 [Methylophilaceae bacterium]
MIVSGNAHSCSAGLILLQDSLELIVLALLSEIGVDERKNLESKSFDELLGELKAAGIIMPKLGTIKALNKQRVITKHYGQLAEPATVLNYYECASLFIEVTLRQVINKSLSEILLTDLLPECEAKTFLTHAIELKDNDRFLECLVEIRKALFVEYEHEYAINKWIDVDVNEKSNFGLLWFRRDGIKAPYWTRNKQWITENVKKPSDFIQIDHEKLRLDAMEWGVSTSKLENLRRLTPIVFRAGSEFDWSVEYDLLFPPNEATVENCNECLDLAVSIFLKKKEHEKIKRWPRREQPFQMPAIYIGHSLYKSTSTKSDVTHVVQESFLYSMHTLVSGFNPEEIYYFVTANEPPDEDNKYGKNHVSGYLLKVE